MNKDILSTLFVGIDVSSSSNYFCVINFAKYAGLTWRNTKSGYFEAETTRMTKTGNKLDNCSN